MSDAGVSPSALPHAATGAGGARILEQGYQRYTGPRSGVGGAIRSVMVHTAQRALGIHRRLGAKVLPILIASRPILASCRSIPRRGACFTCRLRMSTR